MKKLIISVALFLIIIFTSTNGISAADLEPANDLSKDYENVIENTFTWAKQGNAQIFNNVYLASGIVGTPLGDIAAFGVGRYNYADNFQGYLNALEQYVTATYLANNGKLDSNRATEWHRIIFAVLALDGDPTSFGTYKGNKINLIADGVYNCKIGSLWSQGLNGAIYGLLALDSKNYEVPIGAVFDRSVIINAILSQEISGGGFAGISSPNITAIALTALAPYYNNVSYPTVKGAIDRSIIWLSSNQNGDGGYSTNAESCAQVITALSSLNINANADSRFIKNGNSVLSKLFSYYNFKDGGFCQTAGSDSNVIATNESRCALVAYNRYLNNMRPLYDCLSEKSENEIKIDNIIKSIDDLPDTADLTTAGAYDAAALQYNQLTDANKVKITNRQKLLTGLATIYALRKADGDNTENNEVKPGSSNNDIVVNKPTANKPSSNKTTTKKSSDGSTKKAATSKGNTGSTGAAVNTITKGKEGVSSGGTTTIVSNTARYDLTSFPNGIVPKSYFETIKGKDNNIVLSGITQVGVAYSITFHGMDIVTPMDFDMTITSEGKNNKEINELAEDALILSFNHKGDMPGEALIKLTDLSLDNGATLLFYYNEKQEQADYQEKIMIENGSVNFVIKKSGDYFMANRAKATAMAATFDGNQLDSPATKYVNIPPYVWWILGGLFVCIAGAFAFMWWRYSWFRIKVKYFLKKTISIFWRFVNKLREIFGNFTDKVKMLFANLKIKISKQ